MLARLNKLTNWQVAIIIAAVGFVVLFTGMSSPFVGDDFYQIVNNPYVHSLRDTKTLFDGGTFYSGQSLIGTYYRPLMSLTYAVIYTMFGPHPVYFHVFQLLLCVASAFILYLIFKGSFKPVLALSLALIFLVHPINSQTAYEIPAMQDALFFFFGILGLWITVRFRSVRSLCLVAMCLLLSLLAKETGALFVAMTLLYLCWWDRKRLLIFVSIMVTPIAAYLALRVHAIGLIDRPTVAPIDSLGIKGRLLTAPSIMFLYVITLIFPYKLADSYYWIYPKFSLDHVLLPLVIDLLVIALFIYGGYVVRKKLGKRGLLDYWFYAAWAVLGLVAHLQIVPLDMTACLTWFYFSMVGVLGMIGLIIVASKPRVNPTYALIIVMVVIGALSLRTVHRGIEYRNELTLAHEDISTASDNYGAYNTIGAYLLRQGRFSEAKSYEEESISIQPTYTNYLNLGYILVGLDDYQGAIAAYKDALHYNIDTNALFNRIGGILLVYGSPKSNILSLAAEIKQYPQDSKLWLYFAILEAMNNNNTAAKLAINEAASVGQVNQAIYEKIINDQPFTLNVSDLGKTISVP